MSEADFFVPLATNPGMPGYEPPLSHWWMEANRANIDAIEQEVKRLTCQHHEHVLIGERVHRIEHAKQRRWIVTDGSYRSKSVWRKRTTWVLRQCQRCGEML